MRLFMLLPLRTLGFLLLFVLLPLLTLSFLLLFVLLLFRLSLLLLMCVRGSSGSEKKQQNSRADKSNWFHGSYLQYGDFMRASAPKLRTGHPNLS
jgi:hypothetical protein